MNTIFNGYCPSCQNREFDTLSIKGKRYYENEEFFDQEGNSVPIPVSYSQLFEIVQCRLCKELYFRHLTLPTDWLNQSEPQAMVKIFPQLVLSATEDLEMPLDMSGWPQELRFAWWRTYDSCKRNPPASTVVLRGLLERTLILLCRMPERDEVRRWICALKNSQLRRNLDTICLHGNTTAHYPAAEPTFIAHAKLSSGLIPLPTPSEAPREILCFLTHLITHLSAGKRLDPIPVRLSPL
jgi:hypothetical protein